MQMRFGSNLFTGLATGFVVASGLALAGAAGSAQLTTTRLMASTGSAGAVAHATVLRTAVAQNSSTTAGAAATGNARGTYSKLGLAIAGATASGSPWYQAFAAGNLHVLAQASANGLRLARLYPYHAEAGADARGEGFTYQYGQTTPAIAIATGFGTTYDVGHGLGLGGATASASVHKQAGMHGLGVGDAECTSGAAMRNAGALGHGLGNATLFGDAAVKKSGVRYFEMVGQANALAKGLTLSVSVFQQQHALATANIYGTVTASFGGHGHGYGLATGFGDGVGATTGVTGDPATTLANGYGQAQVDIFAKSNGQAGAASSSAKDAVVKHTATPVHPGLGNASGQATGYVTKLVYATAQAGAQAKVLATRTVVVKSTGLATATLNSPPTRLDVVVSVIARAFATDTDAIRIAIAQGEGDCTATAHGYNQINDLLRAPAERTLIPLLEDRLLTVLLEDRLLTV